MRPRPCHLSFRSTARLFALLLLTAAPSAQVPKHEFQSTLSLSELWGHFGGRVALSGGRALVQEAEPLEHWISVWDVQAGELLHFLSASSSELTADVALDGDVALVGYPNDTSVGYVRVFDAATGTQTAVFHPGPSGGNAGSAVDVSGTRGITGPGLGYSAFVFDTGSGILEQELDSGFLDDGFGNAVAIDGNIAVVGAPLHDEAGPNAGAAYIYDLGAGGAPVKLLPPVTPGSALQFGLHVDVQGDRVVVAPFVASDDSGTPVAGWLYDSDGNLLRAFQLSTLENIEEVALDGDLVAFADNSGDVWLYDVPTGELYCEFGPTQPHSQKLGLALDDGVALLTSPWSLKTAFVHVVQSAEVERLGTPPNPAGSLLPGQTSGPVVGATWDPRVDHTTFEPGALFDALIVGSGGIDLPLPFGTLLCDLAALAVPPFLSTAGTPFAVSIPDNCSLVGLELCAQALTGTTFVTGLTNALDVTIGVQ